MSKVFGWGPKRYVDADASAWCASVEGPFIGTEPPKSALHHQIGGDHYRSKAIQPIEFIMANGLGFCEGNVVKYVTRWKDKGGLADLKKAQHYLSFLIEQEEPKGER